MFEIDTLCGFQQIIILQRGWRRVLEEYLQLGSPKPDSTASMLAGRIRGSKIPIKSMLFLLIHCWTERCFLGLLRPLMFHVPMINIIINVGVGQNSEAPGLSLLLPPFLLLGYRGGSLGSGSMALRRCFRNRVDFLSLYLNMLPFRCLGQLLLGLPNS